MAHIHTKPYQHDVTASAYIIRLDGDEPRLMLHRHIKLHALMQFGGHVELDEHPWEAITHEIREEAGYNLDQLQVLQPYDRPTRFAGAIVLPQPIYVIDVVFGNENHFHDDIWWAFVTHESPRYAPGQHEAQDFTLLTRSQILGGAGKDMLENVKDAALFIFDTCLPKWEAVPTAPLTRPRE